MCTICMCIYIYIYVYVYVCVYTQHYSTWSCHRSRASGTAQQATAVQMRENLV